MMTRDASNLIIMIGPLQKKILKPMVAPDTDPARNYTSSAAPVPLIDFRAVVLHVIMGSKPYCHMLKLDLNIRV